MAETKALKTRKLSDYGYWIEMRTRWCVSFSLSFPFCYFSPSLLLSSSYTSLSFSVCHSRGPPTLYSSVIYLFRVPSLVFSSLTYRRSDNDQYGHMNNSIYYHLFDSIVNEYLINVCGLDPQNKDEQGKEEGVIGLVVESYCQV
jgi:hypothetical protein